MSFDPAIILDNLPLFVDGAWLTLRLAFTAFVIGSSIGVVAVVGALSGVAPLRWLVTGHIALMRGIPFIVLMFLIHYGSASLGMRMPPLVTGTAALSLFAGAYYSEVIRACVQALPRGQWESARTIGMSRLAAAIHVVVPQILAPMVPPMLNCTITMIKESSVVSSITVAELTFQGLVVQGNTFAPFEVFVAVAIFYWIIAAVFSALARLSEAWLRRGRGARGLSPLVARYLDIGGRHGR